MWRIARALALLSVAGAGLSQVERQPYFALSTFRTFGSNDKPTVTVSAFNVSALQFRVYRVNDPVQFFRQLEDPHAFGDFALGRPRSKSPIERFHRWKSGLRAEIRRSLRAQFTDSPSSHFQRIFSGAPQTKRGSEKGTHYAEAPVLNPDQLVLTFVQAVQGKPWQQQTVDVPVKERGVYLVEAAFSGELRAYTLLIVSDAVMISKTGGGKVVNFIVDRNTGQPLPHIHVAALTRDKTVEEADTNEDGIAELHTAPSGVDDLRIVARSGRDIATNILPSGFSGEGDAWTGYIYTDRPIYRPGHTVHFKGPPFANQQRLRGSVR